MYEYYNYEDRAEMARQEEIKRRAQEKETAEKKAKRRKWLSTIACPACWLPLSKYSLNSRSSSFADSIGNCDTC